MAATTDDPHDLARFVAAQERDYPRALAEIRAGRKATHWIWYVFPQLKGLGHSEMSARYGIAGIEEARAYLAHPLLGARLIEATEAALSSGERDARRLFGSPDDMKVRSCLTLFAAADPGADTLGRALAAFYDGPDPATRRMLGLAGERDPGGPAGRDEGRDPDRDLNRDPDRDLDRDPDRDPEAGPGPGLV